MARTHGGPQYALLAAALCAFAACSDSTGPDLTLGPYLFRAVAAGAYHTCGLRGDSTVMCWGLNRYGQLGDGTFVLSRWTPTPVDAPQRIAVISAGWEHTCGLTADSSAYCWGNNDYGGLGDGTRGQARHQPTAVAGSQAFATISAGGSHTCGLTAEGTAYCWGLNAHGMLGDGTQEDRTTPTSVSGGLRFASLSAGGEHTCGLTDDGAAYCWGLNGRGQLGAATTETCDPPGWASSPCSTTPREVTGSLVFDRVTTGWAHTCGVTTEGATYCWGLNWSGQLGTGTEEICEPGEAPCATSPLSIPESFAFHQVAAGTAYTCAVAGEGTAYCWGSNDRGQLGNGTLVDSPTPSPVAGSVRLASVSAGGYHTCAVSSAGIVYCWGSNEYGQLGDGSGSLGWPMPAVVWGW